MRDMVSFITSSLSGVGVPVAFQTLSGSPPDQYITFLEYQAGPELEAADEELTTERLIQVNVWSKSNYANLVKQVRKTLESVGFERTFEYDAPYNDGDSHFNKVLRFRFIDGYEE